MNKDIHQELGPRRRMMSLVDCLYQVRDVYPNARVESAGVECLFWDANTLVGHAWRVAGKPEAMWLRVARTRPAAASAAVTHEDPSLR